MNLIDKQRVTGANNQFPALAADYDSWRARDKQKLIWQERILPSAYSSLPPLEKFDFFGLLFTVMRKKMERQSDEVPKGWKKAIHAHGSVAKVEYIPASDSPFTGLFAGKPACGLIRLSVTRDPSNASFAPGLALKLLVDGQHSENFSALVSLTGQGNNHNILANEYSNVVPVVNEIGPKIINLIFRRVSRHPTKIAVEDLAKIDHAGNQVEHPISPEQLYLVPNRAIGFSEAPGRDFRDDLATLKPDVLLFTVHATPPEAVGNYELNSPQLRQRARPIGELYLRSKFVASAYGDEQLFFRHQRFKNE